MKRPLLWASVGMLVGLLLAQRQLYGTGLITVGGLLAVIFLWKIRNPFQAVLCGLVLGLFTGFCYQYSGEKIQKNMLKSYCFEGIVKETDDSAFRVRVSAFGTDSETRVPVNLYSYYIMVYSDSIPQIGARVVLYGRPEEFERAQNPGQFDPFSYYSSIGCLCRLSTDDYYLISSPSGIRRHLDSFRSRIKCIISKIVSEDNAGLVTALLLGEKEAVPEIQKELYERFGLAHILTISGLHIAILSEVLLWLFMLFLPRRPSEILTFILLMLYGFLIGFSVSCIRAVFAFFLNRFGRAVRRSPDALSVNSFLLIIILFICPYRLSNLSFQLSFAAGFLLALSAETGRKHTYTRLEQSFRVSSLLQIGLLPFQLSSFYTFSPVGILLNIVLLSFIEISFWLLLAAVVTSFFMPAAATLIAVTPDILLTCFRRILNFFGSIPFGTLTLGHPGRIRIIVFLIAFSAVILLEARKGRAAIYVLPMLFLVFLPFHRTKLQVTALSVGQGECNVIIHENTVVLIDCGSSDRRDVGNRILLPFLQYYGYDHVDYVFLSHPDSDHINGILNCKDLLKTVKRIYVTENIPLQEWDFDESIEKVRMTNENGTVKIGELVMEIPESGETVGNDRNDLSQIVLLRYGDYRFLFTADISAKQLGALRFEERIDWMKVPHHGSLGSLSEEFYANNRICTAIVSVGHNNYGHPSEEVLEVLGEYCANMYVTKYDGAVISTISDGQMHTIIYKGHNSTVVE